MVGSRQGWPVHLHKLGAFGEVVALSHEVPKAWVARLPSSGHGLLGGPAAQGTCEKHEEKIGARVLLTSEGPMTSALHPRPAKYEGCEPSCFI